ncbi:aconitate hydratase AcnA [Nocardioides albus]|uniref:Aconitate hydratase n=1 Tax=Nocardioides albus TaxID=1841 RepID=A0A7W5A1N0_9ACTN|nr:aconitate hydratase AcnA [Nocardioides albus]MBB3088012.1 aconitate hydratase [Nocardioides albus]GGU21982.1 aconitate hydratase [Nocardioides albus]
MDSFDSGGWLDTAGGRVGVRRLDAVPGAERLPFCHKIVLENLLRHEDGETVTSDDIRAVVDRSRRPHDIAFHPSRVFLHDTNGVPVLTDLAALRDAVVSKGHAAESLDTVVPAHLTVDHSVVTDYFARPDAPQLNVRREYERNTERYRFLKWGKHAFAGLEVVPPGAGIMHQINVEFLADVITVRDGVAFPDTVAGTDSHTTMVNGLSVLAWGVGGIEAEAAMLGQPVSMLIPPVVGVELVGQLRPGVTATDLVLTLTERLRRHGVVGKFIEFFGEGAAATSIATRCTIANMSPEFGSTAAVFPIDGLTLDYLLLTGRSAEHVAVVEAYAKMQGLWHDPSVVPLFDEQIRVDLDEIRPSLAGPRRPQDRVDLDRAPASLARALEGLGRRRTVSTTGPTDGAVAIASITSCTNTSNPAVMVAAGLLARNAVERGLVAKPWVKTSLAPGSKAVTGYLERAGLAPYLDKLGFSVVGYGCMTCIGNSGDLLPILAERVETEGLVVASVLSGNRNFDGRIHNEVSLNYLASPPLVVAYALAGTVELDLTRKPLGVDREGQPVHLADIWPSDVEIAATVDKANSPDLYSDVYEKIFGGDENWQALDAPTEATFPWDDESTYLRRPPFLDGVLAEVTGAEPPPFVDIDGARVLEYVGDSVTTDHICPAGRIPAQSPAGRHLQERGVEPRDLNSYASRRGNWQVMRLGGFSNPRLGNRLVPGGPGGRTLGFTDAEPIVDEVHVVADRYACNSTPLLVLAGKEYGTGSSRDWAAKVTSLLGVRFVLAESFERIHRSNLVGMGILPLQFLPGESADSLGLDGTEIFSVEGLAGRATSPDTVRVTAVDPVGGRTTTFAATVRLDTAREQTYYRCGGLLPFVLRETLRQAEENPS